MSTLRLVLAALVLAASATACGSADATRDRSAAPTLGDLEGRSFVSTDIVDGGKRPPEPGAIMMLSFGTDGVVGGFAGCNTLSARAVLVNGRLLTRGPVGGTEMGCPGRQHHDRWLSDLLDADPEVMLDGDRLTLTSGGTVVQLQDEQAATPDQPLVGPRWRLDAMGEGTGRDATGSSVPAGVTSTLTLREDGTLTASLGCNGGGAEYAVQGDVLIVQPIVHTEMACSEPAMAVESTVLEVLDGRVTYTIEGDRLRLSKGDRTLIYRPVG